MAPVGLSLHLCSPSGVGIQSLKIHNFTGARGEVRRHYRRSAQNRHCETILFVFPSCQGNCARAVAMSSGSGNKSAIEIAKSSPITTRTRGCSTSGFLRLSEIRHHETSVPGNFQPVRTAEIESSLLIGKFPSHPIRTGRSLAAMQTVPKTNRRQAANRRDTIVPQFNGRPENASMRRARLCRAVDLSFRFA